tara:strand:+ start:24978 stop:25787 length:810 start_codon:yes stop_codon:yes gene_type:complete
MVKHKIYDSRLWSRQLLFLPPPPLIRHSHNIEEYNRRKKKAKLSRAYEYFVDDIINFTNFHDKRCYYEETSLCNKFLEMKLVYLLLKEKHNFEWAIPEILKYINGESFSIKKFRLSINHKYCFDLCDYRPSYIGNTICIKLMSPLTLILSHLVEFYCMPKNIFTNSEIKISLKKYFINCQTINEFIKCLEYKSFHLQYGYKQWIYCDKNKVFHITRNILFKVILSIAKQLPFPYNENCKSIVYITFVSQTKINHMYTCMMSEWFNRLGL